LGLNIFPYFSQLFAQNDEYHMKHVIRTVPILLLITLICGVALAGDTPGISNPAGPTGSGSQPEGSPMDVLSADCNLITFEGLLDGAPIGMIPGPVNVTFGSSWLTLIDSDAGGGGNFANEPSASTVAFYLDQDDLSILLDPPVQFLEFFYSAAASSLPVTVTAYDAAGNFVDQAVGNTIGGSFDGANCTGDPSGGYCLWDVVTLSAVANNIASVQIAGTVSDNFGIDNMQFCTDLVPIVGCCLPDASCAELTVDGCVAAGGVVVQTDCATTDCQVVGSNETSWGSIKSTYR
jgi:hypothetical protein